MKIGAIIAILYPFSRWFDFLFRPGVLATILTCLEPIIYTVTFVLSELFFPFTQMFRLLKLIVILLIDIITPVFSFGIEFIKLIGSLIKLLLYLPTLSIMKILILFKDGFVGIIIITKEFFSFFKSFVVPMANP